MTSMRFNFLKDWTGIGKVYTGLTMTLTGRADCTDVVVSST